MTIETSYPDYRTLVEREAPLGFARHFALSEWLEPGYSVSPQQDTLLCPQLPPLPAAYLGELTRVDNRFRWSDGAVARALQELGKRHEGFALLASDSFDGDALSPFELAAACSALMAPAASFLAKVKSTGVDVFLVSEAPLDLRQLSVSTAMATLREASRYCRSAVTEWGAPLLQQFGFSCQPCEQGVVCLRGEESFQWSFALEPPELTYIQSRARLRTAVAAPALAGLLEQGLTHLERSQDYPAARQALSQAASLDPQNCDAQVQLGRAELAAGRLEQAELRLLLASLLRPKSAHILSLLADCYALADKVPQAISVLERVLVLDPQNSAARETVERLRGVL